MLMCLAVLFAFSLSGCSNTSQKVPPHKTFGQTIQEKLDNITNPKDSKISLSSNPYDYIKGVESNEDYKYIVSQMDKSLEFMLSKFADGNKDGLQEYIMAIACSEILKENSAYKNWESGREWYENYTMLKQISKIIAGVGIVV